MKMFEDMMKKIMGGMMKPEDMPEMMTAMMDRCFSEMKANDKLAFMENMMPRCMNMMFKNMSPQERKAFAEKMLNSMFGELKRHAEEDTQGGR